MKILTVVLVLCVAVWGQGLTNKSITSTQCATVATDGQSTVAFQVLGTWTGTIQPQGLIDGQPAANVQVTPANSSSPQSTVTANGAFIARVAGYSAFQVCGATLTNTARIYANVSKFPH